MRKFINLISHLASGVLIVLITGSSVPGEYRNSQPIELDKIYGRIQIVDHFPDYKVKKVDHFPDIRVQFVDHFPDSPGKWKLVEHFPDFKIKWVDHFEDFKIKEVDHFPGVVNKN